MDQRLNDLLLQWVERHNDRLAVNELVQLAVSSLPVTHRRVRRSVRTLVNDGMLAYTYQFGVSYIEKAYHHPVRITDRIVLKPPKVSYAAEGEDVVITLSSGAAFGDGRHPTTRLALSGLEYIHRHNQGDGIANVRCCLDIGSGSGILCIAALLSGVVEQAMAVDIDPCARRETLMNAALNGLERRIEVSGADVTELMREFDLVLANLRLPTLLALKSSLARLIKPGGICIISGVKQSEVERLRAFYGDGPFSCLWHRRMRQWAGVALRRELDRPVTEATSSHGAN
jgi:ribosomal protein L11 methyltransferase